MNIFVLDKNPRIAPTYLTDLHLRKMFVEGMQLIFTVLDFYMEPKDYFYKPIKQGPELVSWLHDPVNMNWMKTYMLNIMKELHFSTDQDCYNYKSVKTFQKLLKDWPYDIFSHTPCQHPKYFIFRCTEEYEYEYNIINNRRLVPVDECVELYRKFYNWKLNNYKHDRYRTYKNREIPEFVRLMNV